MANGHPKFGGTNGVAALDIGQPGGTRYAAGDARATIQVEVSPETDRRSEHAYAQQNLVHEDRLGFAGGEIVWEVNLHTKDLTTQRAIFSDLNSYRHGSTRNASTGQLNAPEPARVAPTQLTDSDGGLMGSQVVLAGFATRGRRGTTPDGATWQRMTVRFKVIG